MNISKLNLAIESFIKNRSQIPHITQKVMKSAKNAFGFIKDLPRKKY